MNRLDQYLDRFAALLERAGFTLMAVGCVGLGLVLFGYLAGWWLLAVGVALAAYVVRSFLRARRVLNTPLTRVDPQRTTRFRRLVAPVRHTERDVRNRGGVVDEDGREVP